MRGRSTILGVMLVALVTSGCAGVRLVSTIDVPVPVTRPAMPRPPLDSAHFLTWLRELVLAQESNCATLEVLRGQSPRDAVAACRID